MADNYLDDKTGGVLILEPTSSVRQMITDIVRGLGFKQIAQMTDGKDALAYLEVEAPSWIILPPLIDQPVNCLQILRQITEVPRLKSVRSTLLLDKQKELFILPRAFELGLFSWHEKSYSRGSLESDLNDLFSLIQLHKSSVLIAAEYLRSFLDDRKLYKSRLAFEENMIEFYPGSLKVMLSLAEAQYLNELPSMAEQTLAKVALINEKLTPHCKRIKQKFTGDPSLPQEIKGGYNPLGVKNCVIIDPDTDVLHFLRDILTKLGVQKIEGFEDGLQAWSYIKDNPEPHLIVQEWRIPSLPGPCLIQRVRGLGYVQVPVLVMSSLVEKDEMPLLREVGVDSLINKPLDHEHFLRVLVQVLQQNQNPTEQKSFEYKIRRLLNCQKIEEAKRLIAQYLNDSRIENRHKLQMESEFEFFLGNYLRAKDVAFEALKLGGNALFLYNLLGKCLLKLKLYDESLVYFEKAHSICPLNLERLINMADCNLSLDKSDKAESLVAEALDLDVGNDDVQQMQCKVALEKGQSDVAKQILQDVESIEKILSFMNSRAVALARVGRFDEGIELYRRVLESLPAKKLWERAAVSYNLSLAYVRYGEYKSASETLAAIASDNTQLMAKVKSLNSRLKECINHGSKIQFFDADESELKKQEESRPPESQESSELTKIKNMFSQLQVQKGDVCCHLIFVAIEPIDPLCDELLTKRPHFTSRFGIERDETFAKIK